MTLPRCQAGSREAHGQRARGRSVRGPVMVCAGPDGLCALNTGALGVSPVLQGG